MVLGEHLRAAAKSKTQAKFKWFRELELGAIHILVTPQSKSPKDSSQQLQRAWERRLSLVGPCKSIPRGVSRNSIWW